MPEKTWRPASEAEATSTQAAFIEWLRAVHGVALGGPADLAAWRSAETAAFAAAIAEFSDLPRPTAGEDFSLVRHALLRGAGTRAALVNGTGAWSRAELLHAATLPDPVGTMLAALRPADLPALAASHLLDADTRPDDHLLWAGDPSEPWPLGAWLVGAIVILGVDAAGAVPLRHAPADWRG